MSDIKFAYLSVSDIVGIRFISEKEQYIGDIDSDDFDSVEFKIYFKGDAPSTINLPLNVRYKDSLNKQYAEEFSLPLRVYTKEQAIQLGLLKKSNITTYVGVVIVLIIVWFVYRRIKKRRRAKKSSSA